MISITIINLKGGVGKSVTACNLAAELSAKSKRVLVVDLDKQGNRCQCKCGKCGGVKSCGGKLCNRRGGKQTGSSGIGSKSC